MLQTCRDISEQSENNLSLELTEIDEGLIKEKTQEKRIRRWTQTTARIVIMSHSRLWMCDV